MTGAAAERPRIGWWVLGPSLSLFGDAALWLAVGVWIRDLTGSDAAAGLAFLCFLLPRLFAPAYGLAVDHYRRRALIVTVDLALAVVVAAACVVERADQIWILYAVLVATGFGAGLHNAAGSALLASAVPRDELGRTNGILRASQETGMLLAPVAGAACYVRWGPKVVVLLECATFVVSAFAVWMVRVDERPPRPEPGRLLRRLGAGAEHLWRTPRTRAAVLALGSSLLAFGFVETVVYALVTRGLDRPAAFVGVTTAVKGSGSVVGGIVVARLARRQRDAALQSAGLLLMAAGCGLMISTALALVMAGLFLVGLGIPMAVVAFYTTIQKSTPARLQGRAAAAAGALVTAPQVLSVATGAALIGRVDYRVLLAVVVATLTTSAAALYLRGSALAVEP
ncbi:MAG TPA: MFS transporter [Frankiaceae bacterium]|nr:MFS transporter [Frankiaceae bacterium]